MADTLFAKDVPTGAELNRSVELVVADGTIVSDLHDFRFRGVTSKELNKQDKERTRHKRREIHAKL